MSSTLQLSTAWCVAFLALILPFRLRRCSENQLEAVMARRSRPKLMQCTSEVMGMSEKRAWSRYMSALLHSKSLTMLRISWRSACRIIPRMFSRVETCFFLWVGRKDEERKMVDGLSHHRLLGFLSNNHNSLSHLFLGKNRNLGPASRKSFLHTGLY